VTARRSAPAAAVRDWALAASVVLATAVVATWPLATSPWLVPAHQDPLFSAWRLYQWTRNLAGQGPGGLFDGNIFYPSPDVLLYSDAILVPALLGTPWIAAGVPVPLVYTALVWAAHLGAGLAMYAAARAVSGSRAGALLAAAVFTGAPARIEHAMHLELLWTGFMPLTVLGTVRLFRGEAGGGRLAALSLGLQFLSCIYYGVYLLTIWPIAAAVEWLRGRPAIPRAALERTGAWIAVAVLAAAFYGLPYQRARAVVGERDEGEVGRYGAVLESYVTSPPSNRLWGWTAGAADAELRLFPGLVASSLAVTALVAPSTPWTLALTVGALVSVDASLGPNGWSYPWLRRLLPPYRGLRVPARFGMITLLCVALLAAQGWAQLARAMRAPAAAALSAALVAAILIESASVVAVRRLPRQSPPVYHWLATLPPSVIVHTPLPTANSLPGAEADFQYFAQYHRHRLLNGNSGFYPPRYLRLLERARNFPHGDAVDVLRDAGAEYLLVHAQHFPTPAAFAAAVLALETRADVTPVTVSEDEGGVVRGYRLEGGQSAR
jgi:hypothetical protein